MYDERFPLLGGRRVPLWSLILEIFLILGLLTAVIFGAPDAKAEPFSITWENDYPVPRGLDHNYTNGFKFKYGDWALSNEMYSPLNKKNPEPPYGDRPWAGYTYLEHEDIDSVNFAEEIILKSRFGFVGEASGTEALQKFVHDDLGAGAHPTWAGQNPSEATLDFVYSKRTRDYVKSLVGDSQVKQEYGVEFGNVKDLIFLDQELRKHFFSYFYPFVGLRGEAILYNTHLDGRLLQDNDYTIDKNWFVAKARFGFEFYFPESDYFFDYHYEYSTEEFTGQVGRHSYGSLTFGRKF